MVLRIFLINGNSSISKNLFCPRERNRTAHIALGFRGRPRPPGLYNLRKSAYVLAGTHILPFPGNAGLSRLSY